MRERLVLSAACVLALLISWSASSATAQPYPTDRVLTHREQAQKVRAWVEKRFDTVLPALMRRHGIDMWIVVSREYADDPVFRSMAPMTTFASRRRTIVVFFDRGPEKGVERLSIGRFDYDRLFAVVKTANDGQWDALRKVVDERNPKTIAVNTSAAFAHADGLTHTQREALVKALGPDHARKLASAERLVVDWLEAKLPEEVEAWRHAMAVAQSIIREAFSSQVITPGTTTTEDVEWWMRQRVVRLGLGLWFHPAVDLQRQGEPQVTKGIIRRGDFLHCDFGVVYFGLATDTQHNAYVLKDGERDAPAGLKDGQRAGNRLQEIVMTFAQPGVSGNDALRKSLERARKEDLEAMVYCHPIGYHGHGAGPLIGMTDSQQGVPFVGDYTFRPDTWHSIELNVRRPVKEWGGQVVRFALEEDVILTAKGWEWANGRQEELYLIK